MINDSNFACNPMYMDKGSRGATARHLNHVHRRALARGYALRLAAHIIEAISRINK